MGLVFASLAASCPELDAGFAARRARGETAFGGG